MNPTVQRVNVLGVGVSAISMVQALDLIEDWIAQRQPRYVCVSNVHSIMACQRDAALRHIHNAAALVTPDGMPLVWLAHRAGHTHVQRVYGPDLLLAFCERTDGRGIRHYFYGGKAGVAEKLAANLCARFPNLQIAGTHAPPFRALSEAEDAQHVQMIRDSGAHVVWVGLGMPKQERWMAEHVAQLGRVLIGVGAAFDFHAGLKPQAPLWMRRRGLEWLFRLATEPRRLWRRYLFSIPPFIALALAQQLGLRRYTLD